MDSKEKVQNNWKIPAKNFVDTLLVNIDNEKLSDESVRKYYK